MTDTTSARLMTTAPHGPTTASRTPAMEGFFNPASSGWLTMPSDSSDTSA